MSASTTLVKRNSCRLCENNNLVRVVDLNPVPIAEKYSISRSEIDDKLYPIDLYMCEECGHVQLLDVIDSETLWDDYTYHSGQTKGIVNHFNEVAENVIQKFNPSAKSLVIDIGSNDGSLLKPFGERGFNMLGIDPAIEIARKANQDGIETIPALFTENLALEVRQKYGNASVVSAFNVFAHADDMSGMASGINKLLSPEGVFVFEVQYLVDILDKMLIGTIFHEHMSHHSLYPMKRFLNSHGMEIFDLERNNIQHGSIIGYAQLIGGPRKTQPIVQEMLKEERLREIDKPQTFLPFIKNLNLMKSKFSDLIKEWRDCGATVAGYGAARSGPTLIAQFGLGKVLEYIFDDHPQKVGKYSPGDGHLVLPTSELYSRKPDFTVILAWIHGKKIIRNNKEYLDQGGCFVTCFPDVRVIGKKDLVSLEANNCDLI